MAKTENPGQFSSRFFRNPTMADPSVDFADFLEVYKDHVPTVFDSHICSELDGFYIAPCSQSRDSDTLTRVNFQVCQDSILRASQHEDTEVHRFGHWAFGWYELLLIHPDDTEALKVACELSASLEQYGCLDDEVWGAAELEAASEFWEGLSVSSRIDVLNRYNLSIFAARRDSLPDDPTGELVSYLAE